MKDIEIFDIIYTLINEEQDLTVLESKLHDFHPYDLAKVFNELDEENRRKIYQVLDNKFIADIFEYLEQDDVVDFLKDLTPNQGASILQEMEVDDATRVLKELDNEEQIQEYLEQINIETKDELNILRKYEDDTAGAMMTTNYIEIESDLDVKKAMRLLINEADETEVIDPLFVTKNKKLVGLLGLKELIIARSPMSINAIMKTNIIAVDVNEERQEVINKINDYGISAMPVLDNGDLVGIITIDDAIDAVEDDVTEHFGKLAGVVSDIGEDVSLQRMLLKRLPWLIILLVLSMIISNVIGIFEDVIRQVTVLIFFQTLILDMAGNIGTQSLAVAIRTLGKGDLDNAKRVREYIFKEIKINITNSFIIGIFSFIVCFLFLTIKRADVDILMIAVVVASSMTITLIFSGLFGVFLPFMFNKIGIDPAVASGPFITTLNDIIAILIYFGLAISFLNLV